MQFHAFCIAEKISSSDRDFAQRTQFNNFQNRVMQLAISKSHWCLKTK